MINWPVSLLFNYETKKLVILIKLSDYEYLRKNWLQLKYFILIKTCVDIGKIYEEYSKNKEVFGEYGIRFENNIIAICIEPDEFIQLKDFQWVSILDNIDNEIKNEYRDQNQA